MAQVITDDFDDGNDLGWTRYDPISQITGSSLATYKFPLGGYQIASAASPNPGGYGPARAGSYRPDVAYTDFWVAVDLVDWDNSQTQLFGLMARSGNYGPGTTTGYAWFYEPVAGDMDLVRIDGEVGTALAYLDAPLDHSRDYRLTLTGVGGHLKGEVFDLADPLTPLDGYTVEWDDNTYTSGFSGLVVAANPDTNPLATLSVTFDNFAAANSPFVSRLWDNDRGHGDRQWETASNWDAEGEPDATVLCIIDNGDVVVLSKAGEEARGIELGATTATTLNVTGALTVSGAVNVGTHGTLTVDGALTAATATVAGALAGSGTIHVDPIEVTGTVAPGGDGDVGELTVGSGKLAFASGAAYDAEVSLGDGSSIGADKVTVNSSSAIHLDGTLAPKGIGRTKSDFFSAGTTVTVIDNSAKGILTGVAGDTPYEFAAVDPDPLDDEVSHHIGQGAFLREVVYDRQDGFATNAVNLNIFVALGGDSDGDGKVWLSDWAALRANFGNAGTGKTWTEGNFDPWADDKVWLSDWAALRANFGNGGYLAGGAAAVPEPGTIAMLLGGLAGLAALGWKRRR